MKTYSYVTVAETRRALHAIHHADPEANIKNAFLRAFADELTPVDDKERWRPSKLLIIAGLILSAVAGVFIYFSLGVSR